MEEINVDFEASILMLSGDYDEYLKLVRKYFLIIKNRGFTKEDEDLKKAVDSLLKQKKTGFFAAKTIKNIINGELDPKEIFHAKLKVSSCINVIKENRDDFYNETNYTSTQKMKNATLFQNMITKENELLNSFENSQAILNGYPSRLNMER